MLWIAGIAVTLFCAAGIAAIMGWIPTSTAGAGSSATPAAAPVQNASNRTYSAPARIASGTPARSICAECGIVESTREISETSSNWHNGDHVRIIDGAIRSDR
jgi:hypothetical protein